MVLSVLPKVSHPSVRINLKTLVWVRVCPMPYVFLPLKLHMLCHLRHYYAGMKMQIARGKYQRRLWTFGAIAIASLQMPGLATFC